MKHTFENRKRTKWLYWGKTFEHIQHLCGPIKEREELVCASTITYPEILPASQYSTPEVSCLQISCDSITRNDIYRGCRMRNTFSWFSTFDIFGVECRSAARHRCQIGSWLVFGAGYRSRLPFVNIRHRVAGVRSITPPLLGYHVVPICGQEGAPMQ